LWIVREGRANRSALFFVCVSIAGYTTGVSDQSPPPDDFSDAESFTPHIPLLTTLPEPLYTICYEYGTPFSHGPIGQEIAWAFPNPELAESAIEAAIEQEPDSGALHVALVTREELADRFPAVLFFDEDENIWLHLLLDQEPLEDPGDTPLPDEPYALFVAGGGIDRYLEEPREGDWVVHHDDDDDIDYVLFFEDLDTAEQILAEFIEASGDHAEVRRTRADTLTEEQGVRYYHASGHIEDLPRKEYLRRCR